MKVRGAPKGYCHVEKKTSQGFSHNRSFRYFLKIENKGVREFISGKEIYLGKAS